MGLWTRMRELAGSPHHRILQDLAASHRDEARLAQQLRVHAEHVPYPGLAATLLDLADQADAQLARLGEEMRRLGGTPETGGTTPPHTGRNYWERLAGDLELLHAAGKREIELAQHWDLEYPQTAAVLLDLAHEKRAMARIVGELVARSDPHAVD